MSLIWRRRRTGTGRKSLKISLFDMRCFSASSDFSFKLFFYGLMAFAFLRFHFESITYWASIFFCSQNWETSTQGMKSLTRREFQHVEATCRVFSKVEGFPLFPSWLRRSKEGIESPQWIYFNDRISCWWIDVFVLEEAVKNVRTTVLTVGLEHCKPMNRIDCSKIDTCNVTIRKTT